MKGKEVVHTYSKRTSKVISAPSNFKVAFSSEDEKRVKYLTAYMEIVRDGDRYMGDILEMFISGKMYDLGPTDRNTACRRVDDLMRNVDLDELYVNKLMDENKVNDFSQVPVDLSYRISAIMEKADSLGSWDRKFILGESGKALMTQVQNRGGYISEKQLKQVERIEKTLGIRR